MRFFTADFETSTEAWYNVDGVARVWLWDLYDGKTHRNGTDMGSFLRECLKVTNKSGITPIYFHNLAYDGAYIVDFLEQHGITRTSEKYNYKTLITELGQWFYVQCDFCGYKFRLYDSLKKIPLSVDKIAKAYGLPISKLSIDYDTYRPVGHTPTTHELDYIHNDTAIVWHALRKNFLNGMSKMTAAADAFMLWKNGIDDKHYRQLFPKDIERDTFCRQAYRGGLVWCNEKYRGLSDAGAGVTIDENSKYPALLVNADLPYGKPIYDGQYKEGAYNNKEFFVEIEVVAKVKQNHVPTLLKRGLKSILCGGDNLITDIPDGFPLRLVITKWDLFMLHENYTISYIEYGRQVVYKTRRGLFDEYITKWYKVKQETTDKGTRAIAKSNMNSLSGKFGQKTVHRQKLPFMDQESGVIKFTLSDAEESDPIYTPLIASLTAQGRYNIARDINRYYDRIAYCDTDSLHFIGDIPDDFKDRLDDNKLGFYKIEQHFDSARYLQPKTYAERVDGVWYITACGMNERVKDNVRNNFSLFNDGKEIPGRLRTKMVAGGRILVEDTFKIHVGYKG